MTSAAPALRHAAVAPSSSAGWALIGPGGSINLAAEPGVAVVDVDDCPDSAAEVPWLAVLAGPEAHPTKTMGTTTRMAPMGNEREAQSLQSRL